MNKKLLSQVLEDHEVKYALKKEQVHILKLITGKTNVFGLLPTGYGKSDCFGWLSAIMDKVCWNLTFR